MWWVAMHVTQSWPQDMRTREQIRRKATGLKMFTNFLYICGRFGGFLH